MAAELARMAMVGERHISRKKAYYILQNSNVARQDVTITILKDVVPCMSSVLGCSNSIQQVDRCALQRGRYAGTFIRLSSYRFIDG